MAVKMILLKTGETLITDAQEVVQDEKVKGYLFKQPQIVRTQEKTMLMEEETKNSNYELDVILTPWMILSKNQEYVVTTDIVATICDPLDSVMEMYDSKVNPTPVSETEVVNGSENIKCLLVDIDNVLISEVEEVPSEIGDPDCKLIKPYRFFPDKSMEPWVKSFQSN